MDKQSAQGYDTVCWYVVVAAADRECLLLDVDGDMPAFDLTVGGVTGQPRGATAAKSR